MQALQMLLADGIVDEVLGQLKSGKEADVWLVSHGGETVAAKIYKEREFRSFKNNAAYKEGREVRNSRTQRAMTSGSRFGQKASEDAWKRGEADTLGLLHASGARVPKPVLFYEGVLLMEVIVDSDNRVAPRLVDALIAKDHARGLYEQVRAQAVKMLCADLIHGDLSEFNVLLAHDGPVVIDFPQVVTAAKNSLSEQFFKRDVENVRRFFASLDPTLSQHVGDADEIWRAYVRRDLEPDFKPSGRPPPPQPPKREQPPKQNRPFGTNNPGNRNRNGQKNRPGAPAADHRTSTQADRPSQIAVERNRRLPSAATEATKPASNRGPGAPGGGTPSTGRPAGGGGGAHRRRRKRYF